MPCNFKKRDFKTYVRIAQKKQLYLLIFFHLIYIYINYINILISLYIVTSIDQRHANPEVQPTRSVNLFPLNKFYVNKESKRCNGCEHNVLKPESNITSIRFKLHQMALFVVPDIRICTIPEWKFNQVKIG